MPEPFLKWPGGKRWLVPYIRAILGQCEFNRYYEPFLGGGAVFFGMSPSTAVLSDVNADLINTYVQVKHHARQLIEALIAIPVDADTYLRMRQSMPSCPLQAAVRFLYLNRTAFGGMYRLNRNGEFNVPFGGGARTPAVLWTNDLLVEAAKALCSATIRVADFEEVLSETGSGDFVYCDPTYTAAHNNNGFIRYNEKNFSWRDQQRLAKACRESAHRGATVMVSNAVHPEVSQLYAGEEVRTIERWSRLCPIASKRHKTEEYLFLLNPTPTFKTTKLNQPQLHDQLDVGSGQLPSTTSVEVLPRAVL